MQERKIRRLSRQMQPRSSKRIHTTHRQWSYMSYWKAPGATFAADYTPASIGIAQRFVLQPFCGALGEHQILPTETATRPRPTCQSQSRCAANERRDRV